MAPTPGPRATLPALSVLVPTHGRGATLAQCLASLAAQTLPPERFEVIVVDDGSPEPVELDPAAFAFALVLLRQEQAGPGAARNRGLERCRAPLTLILNDDAVAAPDLLASHLAAHVELPEKRAVLGTFPFTERARRHPFVRLLEQSNLLFTFQGLTHGREHDWGFFWTCNLSLPTAALREVGGFDAQAFPEAIVEDVELGYRLAQRGWKVVHRADCKAEHDHVLTPRGYLERGVRLGRYLTRMWKKHGDPSIVWARTPADAELAFDTAVHCVELFRTAVDGLATALEKLDAEYLDRPLPERLVKPTIRMLEEVNMAAFRRGMHLERTGIDPLAVMERGAPGGALTSVVIVSCDAQASTRRCIEALRAAREPAHPIELVVVDNGSRDGSAEWLAAQPDLRLVRNARNLGAPRARNQAIALCRGAWLAFLDNDVFVPRGWLGRALYHGAVDPRVGAIPLVANRASKHQQVPYEGGGDGESIERAADARAREFHRRGQDCELFTSLAVLVKREVVEKIGGFDESFSPWGFEDDDLALRVRLAGWRNRVALDAFVFHAPYPDAAKHRRHAAWLQENWRRFAAKWGPPGVTPALFDYAALELGHERNRARDFRAPLPSDGAPPPTWVTAEAPVDRSTPAATGGARNVVVLGSGRSGTSLAAGLLAHAGWRVGDEPYPGRAANPKGFFETAETNGINEYLLASALRTHPPLRRMQRWLAVAEEPLVFDVPPELAARMRRLTERAPFALKDPRFCYTLPAWRAALGPARFVCVFREPALTADSLVRECAEAEYLAGVELDFARALELWCAQYRAVLERHRHEGEWLFVHYDQLLTPEGLTRLEAFVGAPVARDFADEQLSRARGGTPVSAAAAGLYRELCALAGHPARALEVVAEPTAAAAPAEPELSVLVCTYQRKETLARCLASFERQSALGRYELVVVNDGSRDGTREWLDAWRPRVPARVLHQENGGLAAARNAGLAVARGRFVLLVNDDTLADPELVATHLAAHAEHARTGAAGIAVLGTFEQPPAALDNALMRVLEDDTLVFCYSQLKPGALHDWNAFWTCNVSVATADVRAVGGFDESFRRYGCEDTDLAWRLHEERGLRVLYEPRARARHEHVLDLDALARRNRSVGRAWTRMFRKHPRTLEHESWRSHAGRDRAGMERELVQALPERAELERAARELARLDLGALDRGGKAGQRLAALVTQTLRAQLRALDRLWWLEGELEGLAEFGAGSIVQLAATMPATEAPGESSAPWPLASQAAERLLAWPRYDRPGELEGLLETWADAFLDNPERCLCLRHDPEQDGDLTAAIERLQAAYASVVGPERAMEVLMVDGAIPERDLPRLGRAVRGVLAVPGRSDPARESWEAKLGAERLTDPALLAAPA
jgi:GT2 family glycosyltransferase